MEDDLLDKNTDSNSLEDLSNTSISKLKSPKKKKTVNKDDSLASLNSVSFDVITKDSSISINTEKKSETKKAQKKEDLNFDNLSIPDSDVPINILDRFMNFVDSLIQKLVQKFIKFLERNHEKNLEFFLDLLLKRKRKFKKEELDKENK